MKTIIMRNGKALTRNLGATNCATECATLKHRDDIRRNLVGPVDVNGVIVVDEPEISLEVLLRHHTASYPAKEA
jgi:hypothetical protein